MVVDLKRHRSDQEVAMVDATINMIYWDRPFTFGEAKTLLIRHILSDPYSSRLSEITSLILNMFIKLWNLGEQPSELMLVHLDQAEIEMKKSFQEGFIDGCPGGKSAEAPWKWPIILPRDFTRTYPKGILSEIGWHLGYLEGMRRSGN